MFTDSKSIIVYRLLRILLRFLYEGRCGVRLAGWNLRFQDENQKFTFTWSSMCLGIRLNELFSEEKRVS